MFFVGATGQILTLILSVCLPMVFLCSGKPTDFVSQEFVIFSPQNISAEVITVNYEQAGIELNIIKEEKQTNSDFAKQIVSKILLWTIDDVPDLFYIQNSGNKAPPVSHC